METVYDKAAAYAKYIELDPELLKYVKVSNNSDQHKLFDLIFYIDKYAETLSTMDINKLNNIRESTLTNEEKVQLYIDLIEKHDEYGTLIYPILKRKIRHDWSKYFLNTNNDIETREMNILNEYHECGNGYIPGNMSDIDKNIMDDILNESKREYWNGELMSILFCSFQISLRLSDMSREADNHKVQKTLKIIKKLASGVDGDVLAGSILGLNEFIAIKTALTPHNDRSFHEFFIATTTLNKLRTQIPNFVYVFGYFSCGGIFENSLCSTDLPINYLIMEQIVGIKGEETLEKLLPLVKNNQFERDQ